MLKDHDPDIFAALQREEQRQKEGLEMIPSENYVSPAVLEALGSVATNKYAEGYPGARYYGGCEEVDALERLAIDRAKQLFGAQHANVQPLSGAQANLAAYGAVLKPGDTVLGMHLAHGGHLTHGHPVTLAAKLYHFERYGVGEDGLVDMEQVRSLAHAHKPKLILAGYSSYTRHLDWAAFKQIADEVGALTMADIAHPAGLIATGVLPSPVGLFDLVTTTTHKTLRGPRGGMILCQADLASAVDAAVFPGLQGGPHMHSIAAKAVALGEALQPAFADYARTVRANTAALEAALRALGLSFVFGGSNNHMLLLATDTFGLSGAQAQQALASAGITANKNMIPNDPRSPRDPSGLRFGTPAITTRGLQPEHMSTVARWMHTALTQAEHPDVLARVREEVRTFCAPLPLFNPAFYGETL
jgi:glycine hydroxymethyltransferase